MFWYDITTYIRVGLFNQWIYCISSYNKQNTYLFRVLLDYLSKIKQDHKVITCSNICIFYYLHKTEEKILTLGKSIPTLLFFTFMLKISRDRMVCARLTKVSKLQAKYDLNYPSYQMIFHAFIQIDI